MKSQKKAFTLVELMVMVIILMIVWAISFVKYSQYVRDWQDFKRVSDLAQIKIQLDTYKKKHSWVLPLVDDSNKIVIQTGVTVVANQWAFTSTIAWEIWLEKHLSDPQLKIPYVYWLANDAMHYQIATTIMNPDTSVALNNNAYAAISEPKAYVVGDYIPVWASKDALTIPSLIYAAEATPFDISAFDNKEKAVLNGQTYNLVYDKKWDVQGDWTNANFTSVLSESDFNFKKTS